MRKQNILFWVLSLAGLCLGMVCIAGLIFQKPVNSRRLSAALPLTGQISPVFTLRTTLGEEVNLEQYRGRPVVINFWATYCLPCKAELPDLQHVYQERAADGLVLLAINHKGTLAEVSTLNSSLNLSFPLLLDVDGVVTDSFGVNTFPTTMFIDTHGYIRRIQIGSLDENEFRQYLQEILSPTALPPTPTPTPTFTPDPTSTLVAAPFLEGCVHTATLNGRSGPGRNFEVVMGFRTGRCLVFDGRSGDSRWLRLSTPTAPDGSPLWVSAEFITLKGDLSRLLPVD